MLKTDIRSRISTGTATASSTADWPASAGLRLEAYIERLDELERFAAEYLSEHGEHDRELDDGLRPLSAAGPSTPAPVGSSLDPWHQF
jgi:hypothetical protein